MYKKILYLIFFTFLITSCGGTWDSVKRGLTGQKASSTDEFLVEKKDPLVLPPDYENLPQPEERQIAQEQISSFEKKLTDSIDIDESISPSSSVEKSILEKIRKK